MIKRAAIVGSRLARTSKASGISLERNGEESNTFSAKMRWKEYGRGLHSTVSQRGSAVGKKRNESGGGASSSENIQKSSQSLPEG